ncbi:MAG: hypothetical protein ACD_4C00304G0002 [uncultured bacterium (gcode 4)]|uniref:CYTH domain-containing protein n=1 Tax=uncultured bacterium (gcode 4) TaxID=1234023 RepID=K2G8E2_9BACT|nr:MAG: hypothetical protein ACD_4C00304G0002 [uncultured bacterium (gcode 4)]
MNSIEIEVKVLLWEESEAKRLIGNMKKVDPSLELTDKNSQLNHYFINWDFNILLGKLKPLISEENYKKLEHIVTEWKNHSVRTRYMNSNSIFVIKASIDDTTSSFWTARTESEVTFEWMNIDKLDKILLDCQFLYQAKWSRERDEYSFLNYTVCIDKNAWYWYLAEFEVIINDPSKADEEKRKVREIIESLGFEEFDHTLHANMFAYYNENWRDYYWTDKTFTL